VSKQGAFSSSTIVFLIVELVIGAGGGYFASSSNLQPKIDDLQGQVSSLNSEVSNLSAEVTTLMEENSELEIDLETAQVTIEEKENDISDLQATVAGYEEQLSTLETEKKVLESMSIPSTGYEKFSAYGFSLEHPKQWYLSAEGLLNSVSDEQSGLVTLAKPDQTEIIVVVWADAVYPRDLDFALNDAFEWLSTAATSYSIGEKITSTINGHEIKYQDYTATLEGETVYGVYSYWNCDIRQTLYGFSYTTYDGDAVTPFLQYLNTFICHSPYNPK